MKEQCLNIHETDIIRRALYLYLNDRQKHLRTCEISASEASSAISSRAYMHCVNDYNSQILDILVLIDKFSYKVDDNNE